MKKRKSVLRTAALSAFMLALGGTAWAEGGEHGSAEHSERGAADVERQEQQGQSARSEQAQSEQEYESEAPQQQQAQQEQQQSADQMEPEEDQQSTYQVQASGEQSEIKEAQRVLKDQDLYQGNIDGIVGPQTRSALRQFQEQQGLQVSGTLDDQTKQALGVSEGVERQPVRGMEGSDVQRTAGVTQEFQLSKLESQQVQQLQQQLQEQGFYQGEIDGVIGPQTKNAMRDFFQRQAQLVGQDKLSASALQFFGIESSEIQRTSGGESGAGAQPTWGSQEQGSSWEQQGQQEQGTQAPSEDPGSPQGQSPSESPEMEDQPLAPESGEPEQPMQPEDRPPEYME